MAHVDDAGEAVSADLYEHDYYTWAIEQAHALRAHKVAALDWGNLAEEVEGLARSEARELESRLEVLVVHLLKWRFQPRKRSRSWRLTIRVQRQRVANLMKHNPGLKRTLEDNVAAAYEVARLVAAHETGLAEETFPPSSPWTFEQIMETGFWP
jgi:hypothetical protein